MFNYNGLVSDGWICRKRLNTSEAQAKPKECQLCGGDLLVTKKEG